MRTVSFVLLSVVLASGAAVAQSNRALTLDVNPNFNPSSLTTEQRLWYDRLLASISDSRSEVNGLAGSGDIYTLGRQINDYTIAMLSALRATGDRRFLDRVLEIWQIARGDLADAWCDGTTDGYVNWLQLYDPSGHCTDDHAMDEAMTHGGLAAATYALHRNRAIDPAYGQAADFWKNYLENQFLAKWISREGSATAAWNGGFYKRFTHPRANQLRLAYFLHKLTGNTFYAQKAAEIEAQLKAHMQVNAARPSAYVWKHQIEGDDEGWQRINYAHYFMNMVLEMNAEGYGSYALDSEMQKYTSTFRDVVFSKFGSPWSNMAYRVDGSETTGLEVYGLSGFARWDSSHYILNVTQAGYGDGRRGVENAAAALMALSTRSSSQGGTPPPVPANCRRTDRN